MFDDVKFLEYVVKAMVSYPEDIKITRTVDEHGVFMKLDLHPDDMGKVIGRGGNTATAIRVILRVVGMKNNARINLKINEPTSTGSELWPERKGSATPGITHNTKTLDQAMEDLNLE